MKITENTETRLVIEATHWKAALIYAALTLFCLLIGYRMAVNTNAGVLALLLWLGCTVSWLMPMAIWRGERSRLVFDAQSGQAELTHRDYKGLHHHVWPLDEVQSTRVTRRDRDGPATEDPTRLLTLYVRDGMDEGRHPFTNYPSDASATLTVSAAVSDWMRAWRKGQDNTT